ncbi:hypothetical protein Ga0080559_TMP384 (plasmid) [Salipiger profundus]|uniref:Uncharacterized protein n=1 Tax=Salipiger profundus TaxID=1229727 RepID=A0A1U7DCG3_9RHOB|nr:hypothetical protein Ga0080559_TMP384 [Salipiger profundus]
MGDTTSERAARGLSGTPAAHRCLTFTPVSAGGARTSRKGISR